MAFGQTALCELAIQLESKESKAIGLDPVLTLALQAWLLEVYDFLRPRPSDYKERETLVAAFNKMATDSFGDNNGFPIVEAFGSFIMDIFTVGSDLDLSINFSSDYNTDYPRNKKISDLRRFLRFLYKLKKKGYISGIQPVIQARIPVIKVVDSVTGIECDVSAENKDGMTRTSIFKYVSLIDERFRILSFLMKAWAKAHDINSSRDRTMNSLSIISLVAFHLQTRDPPIMPPFSALFKDGIDVSSLQKAVIGFEHFGRENEESIAQLFVTLLIKLSAVESLWGKGLCASNYEGTWIKKECGARNSIINIEDFLDRSQNFARAVGKEEMKKIYNCIKSSLQHLSSFMKGEMPEAKLKAHLFVSIPSNLAINNFAKKEPRSPKRSKPSGKSVAPIGTAAKKRTRRTEAPYKSAALPLSQPGYPNLYYHQAVPVVPHLDYMSQYRPQLSFPPRSDYNFQPSASGTPSIWSQHHPQVPFLPQLSHIIEQRPPFQHQFYSREGLPEDCVSYFNRGLGHPQQFRQSYGGPHFNDNLHPYH